MAGVTLGGRRGRGREDGAPGAEDAPSEGGDPAQVEVLVPEVDVPRLVEGQVARVSFKSLPGVTPLPARRAWKATSSANMTGSMSAAGRMEST